MVTDRCLEAVIRITSGATRAAPGEHLHNMSDSVFTGCMPALMTPCTVRDGERAPDFDALAEKGQELVAAGMSGVVYCGSMGDWPLLTDAWRMEGVRRLVDAGLRVIVGTGAVNTVTAAAHARHAAEVGAAGLMVIPRCCPVEHRRPPSALTSRRSSGQP